MRTSTIAPPDQRAITPARWRRAARIVHPFPTLLNVAATGALAFVASNGPPDASVLARMLVVMLCAQCAIGITNDIFDIELDAAAKPWKPLVAGLVSKQAAVLLAIALALTSALIAISLGPASFALAMLGLACGLAYDMRLKRTTFSALPYMIAIPTLPSWVWVSLGEWERALWWLWPIGALIGLAVHLANTLPDIAEDERNGVRGLAHTLGAGRSRAIAWASFALALVLAAAVGIGVDADAMLLAVAIVGGALCLAAGIVLYVVRRDAIADQVNFGLLGIGSALAATGWLAAVT